jgi:ABC-type enterochelin transport system substrate-binding protein
MTNPLVNAFFLGRATAEILSEELEHGVTTLMSNAGRFDAEQRERLRNLTQTIMERAEYQASSASQARPATAAYGDENDVQEIIDELRAEIAQLRSALQTYRQETGV